MAVTVFLLNLVPFATRTWLHIASDVIDESQPKLRITHFHRLSLVTRIAVIVGDILVLVATWTKTAQLYRELRCTSELLSQLCCFAMKRQNLSKLCRLADDDNLNNRDVLFPVCSDSISSAVTIF
ncbi:hypothetical protein BC629DRAFT_1442218 [Irpex lacteus]|nr:hypothetical protein BC629DRAFT_1442218 [Irpex lacteus]